MIKVGNLVRPRKGSDLDCTAFSAAVGLVLKSDSFEGLTPSERVFELLVEWCVNRPALWENPDHLEKCDGA